MLISGGLQTSNDVGYINRLAGYLGCFVRDHIFDLDRSPQADRVAVPTAPSLVDVRNLGWAGRLRGMAYHLVNDDR